MKDLEDIFQVIYGCIPSQDELDYLANLSRDLCPNKVPFRQRIIRGLTDLLTDNSLSIFPKSNLVSLFRTIIKSFDHQRLNTPFTIRFSKQDIEYIDVQDFKLAIDKMDISVSVPLLRGEYEPHLFKFFIQTLKPGMVFLDIGANVGFYSMLAAQIIGNRGKVFCFEPNSENCRLILLSIYKNKFDNVLLYPFALGNKTGHALFSSHIGSNGGLISDTHDSLLNTNCVITPMIKLEDIVSEQVDLIKIDVEGAEGLVIEGAMKLIERYRPIVTSEFSLEMLPRVSKISGSDYLRYFKANQYRIYLCDRQTQELVEITDIDSFIDNYGEIIRIEDLVFIPQ